LSREKFCAERPDMTSRRDQIQALVDELQQRKNRTKAGVRAKVGQCKPRILKRVFGFVKARLRNLNKNHDCLSAAFATVVSTSAANGWLIRGPSLPEECQKTTFGMEKQEPTGATRQLRCKIEVGLCSANRRAPILFQTLFGTPSINDPFDSSG